MPRLLEEVSGALRMTNLLARDQHYRHVALLWNEMQRDASAVEVSGDQADDLARQNERDMQQFLLLLVWQQ